MRYLYCPQCGTKLTEKNAGDDGAVPFCDHCEKFWFDSFTSCVIVMVYNEYGEIALCKQEYLKLDYMNFTSGYHSRRKCGGIGNPRSQGRTRT